MLKSLLKKIYFLLDPINVLVYRLVTGYKNPIPPAINRARIGNYSIGSFMYSGLKCYLPIQTAISKNFPVKPQSPLLVLDFGIGVGRVAQYFLIDTGTGPTSLHGCDVDQTAIDYLESSFPEIQVHCNRYTPPLPHADEKFDVIYSVSIFTHLPIELQEPWLLELKRILKPGGLLLPTTIGPHGYKRGTHLQAVKFSLHELERDGIKWSPYTGGVRSPGTDETYGATYHTPQYIREMWGKHFDVIDVNEGVIDGLNDLVIMRKPAIEEPFVQGLY